MLSYYGAHMGQCTLNKISVLVVFLSLIGLGYIHALVISYPCRDSGVYIDDLWETQKKLRKGSNSLL